MWKRMNNILHFYVGCQLKLILFEKSNYILNYISGTATLPDTQEALEGHHHSRIMAMLMTFCMTLYTLFYSIVRRVTLRLPETSSSDQNIQEFTFDTMPKEEVHPILPTSTSTQSELLSSVLSRLGELEEKLDILKAKRSEMPYEKDELLNAAVCRVDALEAELIATKKVKLHG